MNAAWTGNVHPAAELFPMMNGDEFNALVDSIKSQGLREPVWLTASGDLLDGRNRVAACEKAGVAPTFRTYPGDDPVEFVVALNLTRRHLSQGQLAMVAEKSVHLFEAEGLAAKSAGGGDKKSEAARSVVADLPQPISRGSLSRDKAADLFGVSGRAVAQAKRVREQDSDLAAKVESGEIALDRADREIKTRLARKRESERQQQAEQVAQDGTTFEIRRGDFQAVLADLDDNSVDLVITDPPYGDQYTHLYGELAEWASAKLKPGGSLLAYVGQGNLPDVTAQIGPHLRYWWTLALIHKHGGQQLPGKWVMVEWKPLVWYVKGTRSGRLYVADRMSGSKPRKDLHEWAQGVDEVAYLIEKLTDPGGLVVDPFAGSGSFGHAAQSLGRHFIGAENGSHKDAQ